MQKLMIISGMFLTSAAMAGTFYMDVGPNTKCGGFCFENPGNGSCCPASSMISQNNKLNVTADNSNKILEGLYFNGIKMFEFDGTPIELSAEQRAAIKATAASYTYPTTPTITKQQYDQGTQFIIIGDDGEWSEQSNPTKGNVYCDHVKFVLNANGGNGTRTVYYKAGAGFFSDAARTDRIDTVATYYNNFTKSGYTLRGFFTSNTHWNIITDTGSYINNLQPYRTIGHAVIRWHGDVTNIPDSSSYLEFPSINSVYSVGSCPDDNKTESSYPSKNLYAGWAKHCVNTDHCEMTITGPAINNRCITPANGKQDVCGRWLPGAVEYQLQGSCYGEVDGLTQSPAKDYTTPYVGDGLYFDLRTANLTCNDTPQPPQTYFVDFQESWDSFNDYISDWTCEEVPDAQCQGDSDIVFPEDPICSQRNRGNNNGTGNNNVEPQYVFNSWFNEHEIFLNRYNANNLRFKCNNDSNGAAPLNNNYTFTGLRSFACLKNPSVTYGSAALDTTEQRARYCKYTVTCNNGYHCDGSSNNTCQRECRAFGGSNMTNCTDFDISNVCVPNSQPQNYVTVTLDTMGGNIDGETTIQVEPGSKLTSYVPDRSMYDGAIFAGWVKDGSNSAPDKNATVNAAAGTSVTYHAAYTCPGGRYMNDYDVCVSDEDEYIDKSGGNVSAGNLRCWRWNSNSEAYENYCYWNVRVTFHDTPSSANLNVYNGNDGLVLSCTGGSGCSVANGSTAHCCTPDSGNFLQNIPPTCDVSSGRCVSISTPREDDYTFRGYFKDSDSDIITTEGITSQSAFGNFFPKNLNNQTISIVGHTIVVVNEEPVPLLACVGEWRPNATAPDRYCEGVLVNESPYQLHVYGGWARKCDAGANASCELIIGTNWIPANGFGKGDVKYNTSCDDGYTLQSGNNTYNPICEKEMNDINLTYTFVDQYGFNLSDVCNVSNNMCNINATYYMPSSTVCGSGYTLKYLGTYSGLYTPAHQVRCSSNVFGTGDTGAPRSVVGYVCRNTCTPEQIANEECVMAYRDGGVLNGNESIDNIWDGCYALQCPAGQMQSVNPDGTIICVSKTS